MSNILVNTIKDTGNNTLLSSDGSGNISSGGAITNTPSFSVKLSGNKSVTADTATKVTFDSVEWDTDSAFSNGKFTVPTGKGGKYFFRASFYTGNLNADNKYSIIYIYKNGSATTGTGYWYTSGSNNSFPRTSATLNLVAGDYIEIYLRMQEGDLNAFANDQMSFFQGYKIIGA
jgi:hypothetical protein